MYNVFSGLAYLYLVSGTAAEFCASTNTGSSFQSGINHPVVFGLMLTTKFIPYIRVPDCARGLAMDMHLRFYKVTYVTFEDIPLIASTVGAQTILRL
jgi:hypothetical protein